MCKCQNIEIGSYQRQTSMMSPWDSKWVCIDTCLVGEIAELWYIGVKTINSCCGHNINVGSIMVDISCRDLMLRLDYEEIDDMFTIDEYHQSGLAIFKSKS